MPFRKFEKLEIPDVFLIEYVMFPDARGFFAELYKKTPFSDNGIPHNFVQVNLSKSQKGVVRGLHYQLRPMEQGKLVYVVSGKIMDVALDIRKGSPWYGKHVMVELKEGDGRALWIPPGFAHGFQALENDTRVLYLVTKEYSKEHERCVRWDDPELGVEWPLRKGIIISEKDTRCPPLEKAETNFTYSDNSKSMYLVK